MVNRFWCHVVCSVQCLFPLLSVQFRTGPCPCLMLNGIPDSLRWMATFAAVHLWNTLTAFTFRIASSEDWLTEDISMHFDQMRGMCFLPYRFQSYHLYVGKYWFYYRCIHPVYHFRLQTVLPFYPFPLFSKFLFRNSKESRLMPKYFPLESWELEVRNLPSIRKPS